MSPLYLTEIVDVAPIVSVRTAKLGKLIGDEYADQQAEFLHAFALTLYSIPLQVENIKTEVVGRYALQHRQRVASVLRDLAEAFDGGDES